MRKSLISAETEEAKARKTKIDKEVERIGILNGLTNKQIKHIQNKIALSWAKFGVNTAVSISQEARGWVYPFQKQSKSLPFSESPESFADDTGYNPFDY